MDLRRHAIAAAAALFAFLVLTVLSASWGMPSLIAAGAVAAACTALFFRYRRKSARAEALPTSPSRDDRVIPQDVKVQVSIRDDGKCQIKGPECIIDRDIQFDHKIPYEWGGSSKDADNIQCACGPCNRWKSNRFADMPGGRLTRAEYMKMTGRKNVRALV